MTYQDRENKLTRNSILQTNIIRDRCKIAVQDGIGHLILIIYVYIFTDITFKTFVRLNLILLDLTSSDQCTTFLARDFGPQTSTQIYAIQNKAVKAQQHICCGTINSNDFYFKFKYFLKFLTNQNTPRIIKCDDLVLQINENRGMNQTALKDYVNWITIILI